MLMKKRLLSMLIALVFLIVPLAEAAEARAVAGPAAAYVPVLQATPPAGTPSATASAVRTATASHNVPLVAGAAVLILIVVGGVVWASAQEVKKH